VPLSSPVLRAAVGRVHLVAAGGVGQHGELDSAQTGAGLPEGVPGHTPGESTHIYTVFYTILMSTLTDTKPPGHTHTHTTTHTLREQAAAQRQFSFMQIRSDNLPLVLIRSVAHSVKQLIVVVS